MCYIVQKPRRCAIAIHGIIFWDTKTLWELMKGMHLEVTLTRTMHSLRHTTNYTTPGFSFVHFLDYAQLKNSRKSEFLAKNLSFQPKNRWVFLEILSFSKVYWSKPLVIKAEILSFHWYWPEFLENLSFRRLWVFRKVDKKKPATPILKMHWVLQ